MTCPWSANDPEWAARYAERFAELEASGAHVHGEADFVAALHPTSVLDAGCGTGRVAVELSRRGFDVCGVDRDAAMLGVAREHAPCVRWIEADLADPAFGLARRFALIVAAGNVMIFVDVGTEAIVLGNLVGISNREACWWPGSNSNRGASIWPPTTSWRTPRASSSTAGSAPGAGRRSSPAATTRCPSTAGRSTDLAPFQGSRGEDKGHDRGDRGHEDRDHH